MFTPTVVTVLLIAQSPVPMPGAIRASVPFATSRPVFSPEWMSPVAQAMRKRILSSETHLGGSVLVAEDGSAMATRVGTVDKVDAQTGAMLTTDDRYRLDIRSDRVTAFNVSQETYIRTNSSHGLLTQDLVPILLLDRYRTFCVSQPLGEIQGKRVGKTARTAWLALIDDRQRSATPNRTKQIEMPFDGLWSGIEGKDGSRVILRVSGVRSTAFLSVDPATLDYRWIARPRWVPQQPSAKTIEEQNPGITISRPTVRWARRTYFAGYSKRDPASFMWYENKLTNLGAHFLIGASANEKYGWLVDQSTGNQWLLRSGPRTGYRLCTCTRLLAFQ